MKVPQATCHVLAQDKEGHTHKAAFIHLSLTVVHGADLSHTSSNCAATLAITTDVQRDSALGRWEEDGETCWDLDVALYELFFHKNKLVQALPVIKGTCINRFSPPTEQDSGNFISF